MEQNELIKVIKKAARKGAMTLDLSNRGITELPKEIGQLVNLQELNLSYNKLSTLPEQIGQLVELQHLDLSGNKLTMLPEEIGQLVNLRYLALSHNHLSGIPEKIGQLAKLRILYLHMNRLHTLPKEFDQLQNLESLYLQSNQFELLPAAVVKLTRLKRLFIGYRDTRQGNPIADLPLEMRNLTKLETLDVSNCPNLNLPPEIVAKEDSPQEILDYYFRSRTQPARPLNEAKVLVVGEAEVGKTSIIKQLLEIGDFDPNENTTHGIITHRWEVPVEDRTVRLNMWDFGGQEIMHATHQFFLTKRSLYVLVLDSRQNERQSRIEYWLKLINSFGEDSPVIVVCNKCDQQIMQLDWQGLQVKYPQIHRYVREVSCAKKIGVQ
jgi:internalin A